MENNQYYNTLLYKPHIDYQHYQHTHESASATATMTTTTTTNVMQHSNNMMVNNGPHIANSLSSSILSPYPVISDSSCSTWQEACPTDYLGLPTFDPNQETSPFASPLSSSSSSSLDLAVHSSTEDFCVSDLLDPYAHHQQHMTSPALIDTTMTTNTSYPTYYAQQPSMRAPHQIVSPNTEYWISPETPLMESMDSFMNTNPINTADYHHHHHHHQQQQQQQQPYFFVKQEDDTASALLTTPSAFILTMATNNTMNCGTDPLAALGYNKKKAKKIHHCPQCHHTSNRANNMKEHILTHDPYRPKLFACNICQKTFARKHDMKRHTKSHLRVPRKLSKSSHHHHHHQV